MKNYARESRPWLIWLTVAAVILAAVGIYFYYNLFRQSKSELIEAIPTDAAFIFALNDNDAFVSSTVSLTPYLNELFVLDALPAYETMRNKLPSGEYDLTVSGHVNNDGIGVLFNTHADKAAFKRLLRALSIDPNNYTPFEGTRIYTYGTNFKSMKFAYVNHIISFSTDVELLKRAIVQHAHPKNLLSNKQFKEIYELSEKNRKQNWLIINPETYLNYLTSFLNNDLTKKISNGIQQSGWTAFQLRFMGNEMFLSGYMFKNFTENDRFDILVERSGDGMELTDLYPAKCPWYVHLETPNLAHLARLNHFTKEEKNPYIALFPNEVGYFAIRQDSVDYQYFIMLSDTTKNVFEAFYGDKADSMRLSHPDGLYPIPNNPGALLESFAPDSIRYFSQKGNGLIFASSAEALKAYQKSVKATGTLSQNRYYPFVNEAVASSKVFNFVLFNEENDSYWNSQFSEKGKASHTGKELRIFSISCETMEKGTQLVPVNLFLHF
jgi:hypothetical protein